MSASTLANLLEHVLAVVGELKSTSSAAKEVSAAVAALRKLETAGGGGGVSVEQLVAAVDRLLDHERNGTPLLAAAKKGRGGGGARKTKPPAMSVDQADAELDALFERSARDSLDGELDAFAQKLAALAKPALAELTTRRDAPVAKSATKPKLVAALLRPIRDRAENVDRQAHQGR